MAAKSRKGLKSSIDDVLGELLGDDDDTPLKAGKPASFGIERARGIALQTSKKGLLDDDFFSKMALEEEANAEDADISDVDPDALLETLKDMDDMEADLLGIKKANSEPVQKPAKNVTNSPPSTEPAKSAKKTTIIEKDIDDPLAGLLSDEEEGTVKKAQSFATKNAPERNTGTVKEKSTIDLSTTLSHAVVPERKRDELTFEDDEDDLMNALGFGDHPKAELKLGRKSGEKESRPARSMLDELLGQGTAKTLLERPSTGERKEFKLDKKYQKQADKEAILGDEFAFGAYQPTVASAPEGRQSRRQSVRFSSENLSELKTDQKSKPSTPASGSPVRSKSGGDWLGLKDDDFDLPPPSPLKESSKSTMRASSLDVPPGSCEVEHPPPTNQVPSRTKLAPEGAALKPEPTEDDADSWLSNVLSQKKSRMQEKVKEKKPRPSESQIHGEEENPITLAIQHIPSAQRYQPPVSPMDRPARLEEPR